MADRRCAGKLICLRLAMIGVLAFILGIGTFLKEGDVTGLSALEASGGFGAAGVEGNEYSISATNVHLYDMSNLSAVYARYTISNGGYEPYDPFLATVGFFDYESAHYSNASANDSNRNVWSAIPGVYVNIHYHFNISENLSNINSVKFTWVGYDELTNGADIEIGIWNWSSNKDPEGAGWAYFYTDAVSRSSDQSPSVTYTSSFSDIINTTTKKLIIGLSGSFGGDCFLAGTKISLADGSSKNIEDVKVGDFVQSYDASTGRKISSTVAKKFYHENTTKSYLIINGNLKVTPNHPMHINGEWREAGKINVGDALLDVDGNNVAVESIETVSDIVPVYNLEVEPENSDGTCGGNNNYYAEGILVHNKCPRVFSHNGTDYGFDVLLNVKQVGAENDRLFNYKLDNLAEPRIRVDYDPNEINYVDFINIIIKDTTSTPGLQNKTTILKPVSCTADFGCPLSQILERDYDYLVLDENHTQFFVEFESFPALGGGYEREIGISSAGYQTILRVTPFGEYPLYVQDFLNEYFSIYPEHQSLYENYIKVEVNYNLSGETLHCGSSISSNTNLTGNLNMTGEGACLNITSDNITLDCKGFNLTGNDLGTGIFLNGRTNVTVKNCKIYDFEYGIYLEGSSNNIISYNTLNSCNYLAINIYSNSHNNRVTNNSLLNSNYAGIMVQYTSNNNYLSSNNYSSDNYGIYISTNCANTTILQEKIVSPFTSGIRIGSSTANNLSSNTITGSADTGIFMSSSNTTLYNNTFSGNAGYELEIIGSSAVTLKDQTINEDYSFSSSTFVFESSNKAKIEYAQQITGSGSNLSAAVRIGNNSIVVDSESETEFNQSANITIYNTNSLGLSDRVPYRNGDVCPALICTELIDADAYAFNVTGFTNYSVGEYPDLVAPSVAIVSNPSPVANGSLANLTINITETNPGKYVVYENSAIVKTATYSNGVSFGVTINTSQPGIVNYTLWANDTSGNSGNATASVTVLTPPTVQLISPGNGETILESSANLVFYSLSAYNSTLSYNLTINGKVNQTGTAVSGANTTINMSGLANGTYKWNVTVWDYTNNAKTSATNTFSILTDIAVETVTVLPIANTSNSSGLIDLASKGVPSSVINETGVTGYEYVVTTNGTTPTVKLNISIFLEPAVAGTSDISGTDGAIGGFYYQITVNDSSWYANVTMVQLKIYYNISNIVIPSGYEESSLRPIRYTSGSWVRLDCSALSCTATLADGTLLYASGADTANKYVWANLSRFSTYGIGGGATPAATATSGGNTQGCVNECTEGEKVCRDGSMFVCGNFDSDRCTEWEVQYCAKDETCENGQCVRMPCVEDWVCGDWSECLGSRQSRICSDWNKCGTISTKPETERACIAEKEEAAVEKPSQAPAMPAEEKHEAVIAPPAEKSAIKSIAAISIILAITIFLIAQHMVKNAQVPKEIKSAEKAIKKASKMGKRF